MTALEKWDSIGVQEYLEGELVSEIKHEYVAGVVYAMAGTRNQHNLIAGNAFAFLHGQLRGHRCNVFNSDTKIRLRTQIGTRFYYPDAMVVCDPNPRDDSFQDAPVTIIEVLSDSTRRTDEGEKKDAYLTIASLHSYLILDSDEPAAQVWQRDEDGGWVKSLHSGLEVRIPLPEIDGELVFAEVYEDVDA